MSRWKRIAAVCGGLAVAGAAVGAVFGMIALAVFALSYADSGAGMSAGEVAEVLAFVATVGGALGAVLAPAVWWACLRHVPLGRAIGGTALGAAGGALVAGLAAPMHVIPFTAVGFLAAAVYMRVRTPPPRRLGPGPTDPVD
ncbi:MAG TPA: hypothetical protein VNA89_13575 [Gemmatimonadaceae bacterium]|nr:hypothetical protein [Gemmatimonadaceae bacterium]